MKETSSSKFHPLSFSEILIKKYETPCIKIINIITKVCAYVCVCAWAERERERN